MEPFLLHDGRNSVYVDIIKMRAIVPPLTPYGFDTLPILLIDITQWYAVALGSLVALSIIASLSLAVVKIARTYGTFYFLKYIYYPQAHLYLKGSGKTTRFDLALIIAFLVGNVLCTTIQVKDIANLSRRSGLISTITLMPLLLGGHMSLIVSCCGISLRTYSRIHR